jgi:hypothetical protein
MVQLLRNVEKEYHFRGRFVVTLLQSVKVVFTRAFRLAVSYKTGPVEIGRAVSHESLVVGGEGVKSQVTTSSKSPVLGTAAAKIWYVTPGVGVHETTALPWLVPAIGVTHVLDPQLP